MDVRRLVLTMLVVTALAFGWQYGVNALFQHMGWKMPEKVAATQPVTGTTDAAATQPGGAPSTGPGGGGAGGAAPAATGLRVSGEAAAPQVATLGSATHADPAYALQLVLQPKGAGIASVLLNDFKKSVKDPRPYVFQEPYPHHPDLSSPLATRSVTINGQSFDLAARTWKLEPSADKSAATYSLELANEQGPVARLTKRYRVFERQSSENGGKGFEITVNQSVANLTGAELKFKTTFNGPTLPPQEISGPDRQILTGYKAARGAIVASTTYADEFGESKPSADLLKNDDDQPLVWAGAGSVYFNAIVLPAPAAGAAYPVDYLEGVKAELFDVANTKNLPYDQREVAMNFATKELTVAPGQQLTLPLSAYFGPKSRGVLATDYYEAWPRNYHRTVVIASGVCGFLTFDWLINLLVRMLGWFHVVTRDWGLAIICLVILVRLILHPITKRAQMSMLKMGKMAPEMERLKKKHGDDKEALNKAMWELQKQQGITPILGCLPMFLQMPIFIALWSSLQSTFELRQAPFLKFFGHHFTWINDLAKPDALISWTPITLFFGITVSSLNILPMLMAVVTFFNQKYTPKPPATTPEMEQQQKMMQWMTLIFPFFFYNMPSGLNLYYLTSTGIGILESKRIRDHIKAREEAEKEGKVFVETKPTRASRRKDNRRDDDQHFPVRKTPAPSAPTPNGWLARKMAEIQERLEQVRREAERKGKP
jgi:YidC/Oxa1 family membrane protein insertase